MGARFKTKLTEDGNNMSYTKYDLKDTTFCIPVFYDCDHRLENFKLIIDFLSFHFDTNIIVSEQLKDGTSYFHHDKVTLNLGLSEREDGLFHRTKALNLLYNHTATPIVVNYDCDVLFDVKKYVEAIDLIRSNCYDIVYPFSGNFFDIPRSYINTIKTFPEFISEVVKTKQCRNSNSVGGAIFCNTKKLIEVGGENENFISWGYEDLERYHRFLLKNLRVKRLEGDLYHITHNKDKNSSKRNPFYEHNKKEYEKILNQN